jgi:hypothetical protein
MSPQGVVIQAVIAKGVLEFNEAGLRCTASIGDQFLFFLSGVLDV